MRRAVAATLWLVTLLASTVAIGAGWTTLHVQSRSGFVDLVGTVGDDPDVRQAAAELAGDAFARRSGLGQPWRDDVERLVTQAIVRLEEADDWSRAWRQTASRTHAGLLLRDPPPVVDADLAPLVDLALDEITAELPIDLPRPATLPVTVSRDDPAVWVTAVSRSAEVTTVAVGVGLIAAMLAVATARRRALMVAALGGGLVASTAVWWVAGRLVAPAVVGRRGDTPQAQRLAEVLADRMVDSFMSLSWPVAAAGLALAAAGLLTRVVRP